MENMRYCNNCHNHLYVPPTATTIRCKCQALYNVGSSSYTHPLQHDDDDDDTHNSSFKKGVIKKLLIRCPNMKDKNKIHSESESSPWIGFSMNRLNSTAFRQQQQHQPKKALLCGVSYREREYQLNGPVNDVTNMWNLLTDLFGYPKDAICVLKDDNNGSLSPTKVNIQRALKWLVQDCMAGDSLVFYFTGHGLRQPDYNDDEIDGYDETLCPVDFKKAGVIFDNEINNFIVKPLKQGVKLHAIVDACHSGTILDLEHVYKRDKKQWIDNKPPSGANKSTSGGIAISLSACADNRSAMDTTAFTRNETNGALTYVFTEIMKATDGKITYAQLLDEMQKKIESVNHSLCLKSSLIKRVFRSKIIQEPQLSASQKIDINGDLNL